MKKVAICLAATAIAGVGFLSGSAFGSSKVVSYKCYIDEIELGQHGEEWAVILITDEETGEYICTENARLDYHRMGGSY